MALAGALIEHGSGYRLDREEAVVAAELAARGLPTRMAPLSHVQRGRVRCPADEGWMAAGSIPFITVLLRQAGGALPPEDSYPAALRPFLHRRVWRCRLVDLLDHPPPGRVFVKPAERLKAFPGGVLGTAATDYHLRTVSRQQTVWCSEVVTWRSEWRAYVLHGAVAHLAFYDGCREAVPDQQVIDRAVAALGRPPAGFALDFGVLDDGTTALVEMNDGYALGCYDGTPPALYVDMLAARWQELLATAVHSCPDFPGPVL